MRAIGLAVLLPLGACAIGNTQEYRNLVANVPYAGSGKVAVATLDRRPYVLDGSKGGTFVGLTRGGFGNPFNVNTESRAPLADDLTGVLVRSLDAKGFDAVALSTIPGTDMEAIRVKVHESGAQRALLLTVREWKSDTYVDTRLHFDLVLQALSNDGEVAGEAGCAGEEDLGGSAWNAAAHAGTVVPPACQKKLEKLLADPAIEKALR
jgi:hypothetical protein